MELHERIEQINSKEDLADFVAALRKDLEVGSDDWENPTLERFLESMEAWIRAMDAAYLNAGKKPPTTPAWSTLGDILYASKIYE